MRLITLARAMSWPCLTEAIRTALRARTNLLQRWNWRRPVERPPEFEQAEQELLDVATHAVGLENVQVKVTNVLRSGSREFERMEVHLSLRVSSTTK